MFGSQAILGQFPDAPSALRMSAEADMTPVHRPELVEALNAIGEDSPFHRLHGFYVHGVPITESAVLPRGWERRTVEVRNTNTRQRAGRCLEGHDLAASKLAAFREKDRRFVRVLLAERMVTPRKLISRLRLLPLDAEPQGRLVRWVNATAREIAGG